MSLYQRYASGEKTTEDHINPSIGVNNHTTTNTINNVKTEKLIDDECIIFPLSGRLELTKNSEFKSKSTEEWINIFPNAAYFCGYDESLFGHLVIVVYENLITERICTMSITKFGVTFYNDLILNANSRFFPSCENLLPIHKDSKVRKALAITNLKNYNKLVNHPGNFQINKRWDETNAGTLASKMNLLIDKKPNEFGNKLLQMGLISNHSIKSYLFDVIYDNNPNQDVKIIEDNNKLVSLLGDQLDQLFDPLLEYSPETLETTYNIPNKLNYSNPRLFNNEKINSIINELLTIQTNFTMGLVSLLQNLIIPLRIHILTASDSNGISKINHIFPPTIDEITRINCVLHDSLLKAKPFGYIEIFKVFGMILPYFYKPFIRHEANLKDFNNKFNKFYEKYDKKIFKNSLINKSNFSNNYIDSIITGSLLELPKIKLILIRLYDSISKELNIEGSVITKGEYKGQGEEKNEHDAETNPEIDELSTINYYYDIAIKIIDAFGGEDNDISQSHNETGHSLGGVTSKSRVFTPTGKILTELASNWPADLQYGWLTRKVIGIFELKNVKPTNEFFHDIEILIIFTDHLLFLKITDDCYYIKENKGDYNNNNLISIPDILMHSLVNEKPLPTLSTFPKMEVSHWCSITDVIVTTYKSFSSTTSSEENFLRFFDYTGQGFKNDLNNELCKNYEILRNGNSDSTTGNQIIELINKAKILHKNQPFHLFRSNISNLHLYATAHNAINYDNEIVKSQIILLLNLSTEMVNYYFEKYSHIFLIFTATYTFEGNIQLIAFNRNGNVEMNEIVSDNDFQKILRIHMGNFINAYFNSFTPTTELMIKSNHIDLEYYLLQFQRYNSYEIRERMKFRITSQQKKAQQEFQKQIEEQLQQQTEEGLKYKKSMSPEVPEVDMIKVNQDKSTENSAKTIDQPNKKSTSKVKPKTRRKSFLRKLFGGFKKSNGDDNGLIIDNQKDTEDQDGVVEYKELYKPSPTLQRKESTMISSNKDGSKSDETELDNYDNMQPNLSKQTEDTTEIVGIVPGAQGHERNISNAETVQYVKSELKPQLQYINNGQVIPIDNEARNSSPQFDQGEIDPQLVGISNNSSEGSKFPDEIVHQVSQQRIQPKVIEPTHQTSHTAQPQIDTINMPQSVTKPISKPISKPIIKPMKRQTTEPAVNSVPIQEEKLKENSAPKFNDNKPFKELYDSSQDTLDYLGVLKSQTIPAEGFDSESEFNSSDIDIIPSPHIQPTLTVPQRVEPIPASKVNVENSRNPSLDVNSHFQFPPYAQNNPVDDFARNKVPQVSLIKDVSDAKLTNNLLWRNNEYINFSTNEDEEANWIQFSRESSRSSVNNNRMIETTSVKNFYNKSTSENSRSKPITSKFQYPLPNFSRSSSARDGDGSFANMIRDTSAADSFRAQIEYFNSQIQNSFESDNNTDRHGSNLSLTPSEIADKFSKEIEMNFSSLGPNGYKYESSIFKPIDHTFQNEEQNQIKNILNSNKIDSIKQIGDTPKLSYIKSDANETPKRFSGMTQGSYSEDEYFSPEEYITTRSPRLNKVDQPNGHGSFSSENTMINELLDNKDQIQIPTDQTSKTLTNEIFIDQFGSMAYLSDILNGNVEI